MFGWMFVTRRFVEHMEAEIEWLRSESRYHLARADRAHDALSSLRVGVPITTAYPAAPAEQAPPPSTDAILKELGADFAQAGVG